MRKRGDFWGEYTEIVREEGVPEAQIRWYLRWAEAFARSLGSLPLKDRSVEDVTRFLDDLKADEKIASWQVEQAGKAIGILYRRHLGLDPAKMPARRSDARKDVVTQPR